MAWTHLVTVVKVSDGVLARVLGTPLPLQGSVVHTRGLW